MHFVYTWRNCLKSLRNVKHDPSISNVFDLRGMFDNRSALVYNKSMMFKEAFHTNEELRDINNVELTETAFGRLMAKNYPQIKKHRTRHGVVYLDPSLKNRSTHWIMQQRQDYPKRRDLFSTRVTDEFFQRMMQLENERIKGLLTRLG